MKQLTIIVSCILALLAGCTKEELSNSKSELKNQKKEKRTGNSSGWTPTSGTELSTIDGFFEELEDYQNNTLVSYNLPIDEALWKIEAAINYTHRNAISITNQALPNPYSTEIVTPTTSGSSGSTEITALKMYENYETFISQLETILTSEEFILVADIELENETANDVSFSMIAAKAIEVEYEILPPAPTLSNGIINLAPAMFKNDWKAAALKAGTCSGARAGEDATTRLTYFVTCAEAFQNTPPSPCVPPLGLTMIQTNVKRTTFAIGPWNTTAPTGFPVSGTTVFYHGPKVGCILKSSTGPNGDMQDWAVGGQHAIDQRIPPNKDVYYVEYTSKPLPGGNTDHNHEIKKNVLYGDNICGPAAL